MDRTEPIPLITFGEEYPEEPAHPHRCTPPNVVRLGSGAACPTTHLDVTPPYPMPSFLLKKYQASRTASGCGTPSGSNCLPTPVVLTTNNSFAAKSEASSDGMNDVRVVPDVSNDTRDGEAPAATDYHYDSAWDHTYENYNEYDDHQQHYDEQPAPAYTPPAPAYPPLFSNRATRHHSGGQYQQKQQQWYYTESAPSAPTGNYPESAPTPNHHESALSDWQQQLQMRQQRAPRTADFGFGATPDEERNRASAQNRRLPPAELKRLRKFFNNRNEHSHPTARSST